MQNLSLDLMSVLGFGIYLGVGNTSDMIMMAFLLRMSMISLLLISSHCGGLHTSRVGVCSQSSCSSRSSSTDCHSRRR